MNIAQILHEQAACHPETPAIIDTYQRRQRVLSFAGLEAASARAAALLLRAGLEPGDTVLVFQPMTAELYIVLAAIFRLGLTAMFVDPGQGKAHLEQCCAIRPPQALIASAKAHLLRFVSPALRRIPRKFVIGLPLPGATSWRRADHLPPEPDVFSCTPDTPALLTFTSGSTGRPRAALRSHGFLLAQHQALTESLQLAAGQLNLATMPIVALSNLASGVTSLIPQADLRYPGQIDPAPVVAQIKDYHVGSIVASPALLERLACDCLRHQRVLASLEKIFTGGAPVFPRLLDQLHRAAPQAELAAVYGSTEAEPMAKLAWSEIEAGDHQAMRAGRGLLAGRPVAAIQLRIISDQWGQVIGPYSQAEFTKLCCSPGEAGEIVVSGGHVLAGYLHGEGDAETTFQVEGTIWRRTGDAGYLDERGRLWLLGRCAARIEDERGVLYPFAVEAALSYLPQLRRSALVALNWRRILAVEFHPQVEKALAPLREALAWTQIDEIRVYPRLPVDKRHNAKIDYPALYKLLGAD
jgi:acyl-CoA synthetase (AMP-forming)/AMP-acid ligase II